jgi:hypothetical protein
MDASKSKAWVAIVSSGLGVALFTFVANKAWEVLRHHPVSPKYVDTSMRFENNQLFVFVRNNSDDPLDLTEANLNIDEPSLTDVPTMGAYPDVSKLYDVASTRGSAHLQVVDNRLVVKVKILQAINPKAADQFALTLTGLTGPVDLSRAKIQAQLHDIKGHIYIVSR